jgi:hypothetical protein
VIASSSLGNRRLWEIPQGRQGRVCSEGSPYAAGSSLWVGLFRAANAELCEWSRSRWDEAGLFRTACGGRRQSEVGRSETLYSWTAKAKGGECAYWQGRAAWIGLAKPRPSGNSPCLAMRAFSGSPPLPRPSFGSEAAHPPKPPPSLPQRGRGLLLLVVPIFCGHCRTRTSPSA